MDSERATTDRTGVPEFTELGKRIEVLRIERGLSKQYLARVAGTSRQQLWRVMTGKSELSGPLKHRLLDVLRVNTLDRLPATLTTTTASAAGAAHRAAHTTPRTLNEYLADPDAVVRTLATLPAGARGRSLKRRVLDAIEDGALDAGIPLGADFFDVRRRVLTGDL